MNTVDPWPETSASTKVLFHRGIVEFAVGD
jgi:hypothetical protein